MTTLPQAKRWYFLSLDMPGFRKIIPGKNSRERKNA